jgi:membrane-associated phospholipid phosphatase
LLGRFRPGTAAGLQLTVSLVALALLGYALAVVIGQVLGNGGLVDADETVRRYMAESSTSKGRDAMLVVRNVLSPKGAWVLTLIVGGGLWLNDRRPRALVLMLGAVGGAALLTEAVQEVIGRAEVLPSFGSAVITEFPSRHMTMVVACLYALLAVLLPRTRRWPLLVATVAVALGLVVLAGLAVLYLERVLFSDVVGGVALGALWGLAVVTAVATVWRPRPPAPTNPTVPDTTRR